MNRPNPLWNGILVLAMVGIVAQGTRQEAMPSTDTADGLDVEVTKKGAGKEVLLRDGDKEWYMLVEVTPDNTVVIRQEKEQETYLVDESETHDRAFGPTEVDAAIQAFIDSVRTQRKATRR